MLLKCNSNNTQSAACGAECSCLWQIAVAFWSLLFSFSIGCIPSIRDAFNDNATKYRVASSSMAPTWFGPHLTATCNQCGQQSPVVEEAYDPLLPTRCFSCGAVCSCSSDCRSGEAIEISRCTASSSLKRFDVVTFDSQKVSNELSPQSLKRVWALPGERIELHGGEAWIDGKPLQKTSQELAAICVPLSRFPKDVRSHWRIVDSTSSEGTRIEAAANESQLKLKKDQQLEFRYVRPNRNHQLPEMLPSQIVDDFPFNQNSISQFHEVDDFLLAIELVKPVVTLWHVSLQSQGKRYTFHVGSDNASNANSIAGNGANRFVMAVCDGRLLVSTENKNLEWRLIDIEVALDKDDDAEESMIAITTTQPLGIKRLLVARDHWLGPRASRLNDWTPSGTESEIEAEAERGYFVLGDNLQLSIDSRDPAVGRIAKERVTGHVKRLEDSPEWILALLSHTFRETQP